MKQRTLAIFLSVVGPFEPLNLTRSPIQPYQQYHYPNGDPSASLPHPLYHALQPEYLALDLFHLEHYHVCLLAIFRHTYLALSSCPLNIISTHCGDTHDFDIHGEWHPKSESDVRIEILVGCHRYGGEGPSVPQEDGFRGQLARVDSQVFIFFFFEGLIMKGCRIHFICRK